MGLGLAHRRSSLSRPPLWRSPLGYQYLRDATGTLDVTPDPERLRLATTVVVHFRQHDASP